MYRFVTRAFFCVNGSVLFQEQRCSARGTLFTGKQTGALGIKEVFSQGGGVVLKEVVEVFWKGVGGVYRRCLVGRDGCVNKGIGFIEVWRTSICKR